MMMWRICVAASLAFTNALPITSSLGHFEIEPSGRFAATHTVAASVAERRARASLSETHRSTNNATSSNATISAEGDILGTDVKASGNVVAFTSKSDNITKTHNPVRVVHTSDLESKSGEMSATYFKESVELTRELNKGHEKDSFVDWIVLGGFTLALIVADYVILQAMPTGFKARMICIIFWVGSGMCFSIYIWISHGPGLAALWLNGYYLEYVMSFDNLLVFAQIFQAFRTPEGDMHKALYIGVWSCIFLRLVFFTTIGPALTNWNWVHYVLGVILMLSGVVTLFDNDDCEDDLEAIQKTYTVRFLRWALGGFLHEDYDREGHQLFCQVNGKTKATMLMLVVLALELIDLLLALDTTSIKVVILPTVFTAYSCTLMGCLGLRSLFFVLQYSVQQFALLNYGIVVSLMFVAIALLFEDLITLERWVICVVVTSILVISGVLSTLPGIREEPKEEEDTGDVPEASIKDDIVEVSGNPGQDLPSEFQAEKKKVAEARAS